MPLKWYPGRHSGRVCCILPEAFAMGLLVLWGTPPPLPPPCKFLALCFSFPRLRSASSQLNVRWQLGVGSRYLQATFALVLPSTHFNLGDHAAYCRHGGDVVARPNHLRDIFADFCHRAHLPVKVEVGYGLGRDNVNSRPADVLVQCWDRGKPTAFDVTVMSSLTPITLGVAVGEVAESRKQCSQRC